MVGNERVASVKVKDLDAVLRALILRLSRKSLVCRTGILKSWVNWYSCTWLGLPVMAL